MGWWPFVGFAALVGFILWRAARSREIFCLTVRDGTVLVVRGRVLATTFEAIADVSARSRVPSATVRALRDGDTARIVVDGEVTEAYGQQLRNVFGLEPLRRLLTAPGVKHPTLGQRLGWAWLIWREHDEKQGVKQ